LLKYKYYLKFFFSCLYAVKKNKTKTIQTHFVAYKYNVIKQTKKCIKKIQNDVIMHGYVLYKLKIIIIVFSIFLIWSSQALWCN